MAESLTDHIKRRAAVIAERVELELTVAGTEYAPLERAVFKGTKNNTKVPKEKHVLALQRAIADGEYSKTVLKMLARRLKEVGQERISSGSLAAGIKTLAVWHRCLNSGDRTFLTLCAQYTSLIEPPASNALGQMYGAYLREMLTAFSKTKHAFQRDTMFEDSHVAKLGQIEVVEVVPYMMNQMKILLVCDLQGGLMDSKTRYSVQYAINLLVLDSIGLFNAIDTAMDRIRDFIGRLKPEDAQKMAGFYEKYTKMPSSVLALLKQASLDHEVAIPVTAFDSRGLKEFKKHVEKVQAKLRTEDGSYETVKALADVAVHTGGEEAEEHVPATRFTLDELDDEFEGHEEKGNVQAPPATDLLCFDDATPVPHPQKQQQAQSSEAWDPFGPSAPQAAQAAAVASKSGGNSDWDPFGGDANNPFGDAVPQAGGGGFGVSSMTGATANQKAPLTGASLASLYNRPPNQGMTDMMGNMNLGGNHLMGGAQTMGGGMGMGAMGGMGVGSGIDMGIMGGGTMPNRGMGGGMEMGGFRGGGMGIGGSGIGGEIRGGLDMQSNIMSGGMGFGGNPIGFGNVSSDRQGIYISSPQHQQQKRGQSDDPFGGSLLDAPAGNSGGFHSSNPFG